MPNWCTTRITINNDNQEELSKFNKLLDKWMETNYMENDFGLDWLGNIVGNSGIGTVDTGKETDLSCRGYITDKDLYENQLTINTETAWQPMLKMWDKLLEKYLPEAELIYEAEECGCELYCTNDPVMRNKYYIDCWGINDICLNSDCEAIERDVIDILQSLLKTKETNIDKLMEMLRESEYNSEIAIYKWEFAETTEWYD